MIITYKALVNNSYKFIRQVWLSKQVLDCKSWEKGNGFIIKKF